MGRRRDEAAEREPTGLAELDPVRPFLDLDLDVGVPGVGDHG